MANLRATFQLMPPLTASDEQLRLAVPCPTCKAPTGTPCTLGQPRTRPDAIQEHARRYDRTSQLTRTLRIAVEEDLFTIADCLDRSCHKCARWVTDTLIPIAVLCPAVNDAVTAALAAPPKAICTAATQRRVADKKLAGFIGYVLNQTAHTDPKDNH